MTDNILITPAYILAKHLANSNTVIFVNGPGDRLLKAEFVFTSLSHANRGNGD